MSALEEIDQTLQDAEAALLEELRAASRRVRELFHRESHVPSDLTLGQRIADRVAATMGSWPFIIIMSIMLSIWIALNATAYIQHWDPYPFILLNLMLSFQAAYAAPFIMMSQNRQSEVDRSAAATDHQVNLKAELEVEMLHRKIDALRETEIMYLSRAVHDLVLLLQQAGIADAKGKPNV